MAELGVAAGEERDRAEAGERGARGVQLAQRRPALALVPEKSSVIQAGERFLVRRAQPVQARQRDLVGAAGRVRASRRGVDEPLHPRGGGDRGPAAARSRQFGERRERAGRLGEPADPGERVRVLRPETEQRRLGAGDSARPARPSAVGRGHAGQVENDRARGGEHRFRVVHRERQRHAGAGDVEQLVAVPGHGVAGGGAGVCPRRVPPAASGRRVDGRGVRAAKQRVLIEVGRQRDKPLGPVRGLVPGAYPVVGQHSSHAGREELPPRLERHRRRPGRRRRVLCGLRRGEVPGGRRQFVAPEQDRAQPCPQHRAVGVVKILAAKLRAQRSQRLLRLAVPRQALGGDHLRHGARDTGAGSRRGAACPGRGLRGPAPGEQQQRELAGRRRRVFPADAELAAGASAAGPPGTREAGVRQPAPRGPRIAGRDGETAEQQAARGRRRRRGYLVGEAARRRGLAEVEKQPGGRLEQAIAFRAAGGDAERREVQVAGLGQPARRPVSLGVPGQLPRERGVGPPARRDPVGQRLRPTAPRAACRCSAARSATPTQP